MARASAQMTLKSHALNMEKLENATMRTDARLCKAKKNRVCMRERAGKRCAGIAHRTHTRAFQKLVVTLWVCASMRVECRSDCVRVRAWMQSG